MEAQEAEKQQREAVLKQIQHQYGDKSDGTQPSSIKVGLKPVSSWIQALGNWEKNFIQGKPASDPKSSLSEKGNKRPEEPAKTKMKESAEEGRVTTVQRKDGPEEEAKHETKQDKKNGSGESNDQAVTTKAERDDDIKRPTSQSCRLLW